VRFYLILYQHFAGDALIERAAGRAQKASRPVDNLTGLAYCQA
jgi:hypothetical protein